ncbi:hypothetical protein BgiBS90_023564, partial [Biomphalaria glabrata]
MSFEGIEGKETGNRKQQGMQRIGNLDALSLLVFLLANCIHVEGFLWSVWAGE